QDKQKSAFNRRTIEEEENTATQINTLNIKPEFGKILMEKAQGKAIEFEAKLKDQYR
ncbi:unnamed protein product, partial [Heterotrigona itama]